MVAKGFMAAAAIIICCATTLRGNDQETKCSGGDCPTACSEKEKCSALKTACADGKCDDEEQCCEKKQVSLEKCSAGTCDNEECSASKWAKSNCSTEQCSTEKCSAVKCGGEKCAFSVAAGATCGSLKCALEGAAKKVCVAEGTCETSTCSTEQCADENCPEGACNGESCPVAACADQVCDALKCALDACTIASDDQCCEEAVCATGSCGTSQCASLQCSGQDCPAGQCNGAPCSDEVCNGLKCAVEACLTARGGELRFTATKSFAGRPAEKCSTENCTTGKCATEQCALEKCVSETCSKETCGTSVYATDKCAEPKCRTATCTASASELETKLAELERMQHEVASLRRATGAPEQMIVKVTVFEVNRTKCRNLEFDFGTNSVAGKGDLVSQIQRFPAIIEALQRNRLACVMAEPTLAVTSGRPAKFRVGRSALMTDSNGNTTEGELGTSVNVLARSIGGNKVRVEIRPEFDEIVQGRTMAESHSFDAAFETTLGSPFVLAEPRTPRVKAVTRIVDGEQRTNEEIEEFQRLTVVTVEGVEAPVERPAINQAAYEASLLQNVQEPKFVTRVYPVPDLQVWKVRPQGVQFDADLLVAHVKSTIAPQSWRGAVYSSPAEGQHADGAIQPFERNGSLVICQTEENHEKIAALFQKMRADGQQKDAARQQEEALREADRLGVTIETTGEGVVQAHVVSSSSAEEPVEKCNQGECSESKCNGSECTKSEVSLESEPARHCPGDCQGKCDGECPETAACPCIGGACTR